MVTLCAPRECSPVGAPVPKAGLPAGINHLTAIACGYTHALALRNNGTVVASGTGVATNVPAGLANVIAIAAGYSAVWR